MAILAIGRRAAHKIKIICAVILFLLKYLFFNFCFFAASVFKLLQLKHLKILRCILLIIKQLATFFSIQVPF